MEALRAERKRLYQELLANPTFKKYDLARRMSAAYADAEDNDEGAIISPPDPSSQQPAPIQRMSRPGSRASEITEATAKWFSTRQPGQRAQSLEIMRVLQARGFTFVGTKPTAALASVLSHSDLFDNVRGEGYGLKSWSIAGLAQPQNLLDTAEDTNAEQHTADPATEAAAA